MLRKPHEDINSPSMTGTVQTGDADVIDFGELKWESLNPLIGFERSLSV